MSSDPPKLRNSNLLLVKSEHNLKAEEKNTNLETDIITLIYHKYQDISKHKNDHELIKYILNCVEECFKGDPNKTDPENEQLRIDLIVGILVKLFPDFNTPEKIDDIKALIKFIENNKLVNAVSCCYKLKKNLLGLISKK
jgi:hypothetical protein